VIFLSKPAALDVFGIDVLVREIANTFDLSGYYYFFYFTTAQPIKVDSKN